MSALSIELSTEQTRKLAEVAVREGLPPADAPGLELIAEAVAQFSSREITLGDFVAEVDRVGPFIELGLLQRIDPLEREPVDGAELAEVRAGLRWLQRFPWREPRLAAVACDDGEPAVSYARAA